MDFWYIYFLIGVVWGMLTVVGAGWDGQVKSKGVIITAGLVMVALWPLAIIAYTLDKDK